MNATGRAAVIREWLKAQKRPCTAEAVAAARARDPHALVGACPAEIAEGTGAQTYEERMRTYWSVGLMFKDGILDREGVGRGLRYFLVREPKPFRLTPEQRRERINARARARYLANGGLEREARKALNEQRRRERAAESARKLEARAAALAAKREAERARRAVPKVLQPKPAKVAKAKPAPTRPTPPAPTLQRMESVSEFLARGGRIDRLPGPWEQAA